jgi:hypothetical protein
MLAPLAKPPHDRAEIAPQLRGRDCSLTAVILPCHLSLLSTLYRTCGKIGKVMWPMEANVIEGVPGTEIAFCRADDVRWDWWSDLETRKRNHDFFTRRRKMSRRLRLMYAIVDLVRALQRRLRRGNG